MSLTAFLAAVFIYSAIITFIILVSNVAGVVKFIGGRKALMDPRTQTKTKEIVAEFRTTKIGKVFRELLKGGMVFTVVSFVCLVVSGLFAIAS